MFYSLNNISLFLTLKQLDVFVDLPKLPLEITFGMNIRYKYQVYVDDVFFENTLRNKLNFRNSNSTVR